MTLSVDGALGGLSQFSWRERRPTRRKRARHEKWDCPPRRARGQSRVFGHRVSG